MTTVKLMTIADIAAELGVTGQAISAWHKGEQHDTPEPPFVITTPHARRKFELLWRAEDMTAWHEFADAHIVALRETAQEKADKAIERAAKAQAAAEAALARVNKSVDTGEVPSVEDAEAVLNGSAELTDAAVDVIDAAQTPEDDWSTLTPEELAEVGDESEDAPELGGTEDFPEELAETGSKRGRRR
jgi:predicted transcriptional regulator